MSNTVKILHNCEPTDMEIIAHDAETESVVLRDPKTDQRVHFEQGYPQEILEDRGGNSKDERGDPNRFRAKQLNRGDIESALAGNR